MNYEETLGISYNRLFETFAFIIASIVFLVYDYITYSHGDMNYMLREVRDLLIVLSIFYYLNIICKNLGHWGILVLVTCFILGFRKPIIFQTINMAVVLGSIYIIYVYLIQPIIVILQLRKEGIVMEKFSPLEIVWYLLRSAGRLVFRLCYTLFTVFILIMQLVLFIITFGVVSWD